MPLLESWLADLEQRLGRAWCWTSAGGRALTRGRALSDDGSVCRRCASTTRGSVKQKKKGPSMSSLTLHHRWSQEEVAEGTRQMSLHLLSTCTCPVLMACSRRADLLVPHLVLVLHHHRSSVPIQSHLIESQRERLDEGGNIQCPRQCHQRYVSHVRPRARDRIPCGMHSPAIQRTGEEKRKDKTRQAQDRTDGSVR